MKKVLTIILMSACVMSMYAQYSAVSNNFGVSAKVGYNQFNIHSDGLNNIGGANTGLEAVYRMDYMQLRLQLGVDVTYAGNALGSNGFYKAYALSYPANHEVRIYVDDIHEQAHSMEIGFPVMIGANLQSFYVMGGMRFCLPVYNTYHATGELSKCIYNGMGDILYNDMEVLGIKTVPYEAQGQLDWKFNPEVCVEAGVNLDNWMNLSSMGGLQYHIELGLYANVGVCNHHTMPSAENTICYIGTNNEGNVQMKFRPQSFTTAYETGNGRMIPWSIGAKVSFFIGE